MSGEGYRTKQRGLIVKFLKMHSNIHLTADQVAEALKQDGVSRSTVYRCLERMVENGELRRYNLGEGNSACYQYSDSSSNCKEHHHLKCVSCGKLFHAECEHLNELAAHLLSEHGFLLDSDRTVLYGLCSDCVKESTI